MQITLLAISARAGIAACSAACPEMLAYTYERRNNVSQYQMARNPGVVTSLMVALVSRTVFLPDMK